jgi:hypothetical protein
VKKPFEIKAPLTQQGAFRRDRSALRKAEKLGIPDRDLILQMAANHSQPNTAQAFLEASGAVIHTRANMARETPIADAIATIVKERKAARQKHDMGDLSALPAA